jgi:hypothetical protein
MLIDGFERRSTRSEFTKLIKPEISCHYEAVEVGLASTDIPFPFLPLLPPHWPRRRHAWFLGFLMYFELGGWQAQFLSEHEYRRDMNEARAFCANRKRAVEQI